MSALLVDGTATLKHLNVRKEKSGGDEIVAVDAKFHFAGIGREICAFFDPLLEEFLFRKTASGEWQIRSLAMAPVEYDIELEGSVELGSLALLGCKFKRFTLAGVNGGMVELGVQVSCFPNNGQLARLAWSIKDEFPVTLRGLADLLEGAHA